METEYRDPGKLAGTVILWIWIWLAAEAALGLASAYQLVVLSGLPPDWPMTITEAPPETASSDIAVGVTGLVTFVSFLVSGILVLRWIYRTNANAHMFAEGMNVSPGWNVGWFFVPIANLIKPFQGVRETWQVSQGAPNWEDEPVPPFMRWWWGCWLVANLIENLAFRLSLRLETVGEAEFVAMLDVGSVVVSVPLGLLLIRLIRELTQAQIALNSRVDSG